MNQIRELVDLPPGARPVSCKWIFKKILRFDGFIEKLKGRLVVKSFTQKEGINFFNIYSRVAKITTVKMLIVFASIHKLIIHQMDVKKAFLHGKLNEEIYTNQPEGFVGPR